MISRRGALAGLGAGGALFLGRGVALAQATSYSRIVSVGGAVTETLFALGLGEKLRAVDTTSTYPAEALQLPKVGYLRQLSAEGVLSMRPDLILLSSEAGPAAAIDQLEASGIPLAQVPVGRSADGLSSMINAVGDAAGFSDEAQRLAGNVETQFNTLMDALPSGPKKSVLLILSAGNGPLLGAGANTAASAIIDFSGGALAFPEMEGYKAISMEPVLAADPDWIVLPSHVCEALGGPEGVAKLDIVSRTTAGAEGRVAVIDSHYLLGFGPRVPMAAADLASLLYPEAGIPTLGREAVPSSHVTVLGAR
ncbi:ABC transporter substrate-binding protein [Parvibaculaceae bacterium PLY_AMNH_Bact1]|nr:ABC transporter substrate-binding protein [Parvibaculaceae bacterium PLY_AMNH_Bact1]